MRTRAIVLVVVAVVAIAPAARAGDGPSLIVPASSEPLFVSLPVPAGIDAAGSFRLAGDDEAIPASVVGDRAADGAPDPGSKRLTAAIPPAANPRRLRLVPVAEPATSPFRIDDADDRSVVIREGDRPVLVYNHGVIAREGVPADRARSSYVHPLYGLDGEVLTDDFPRDHHHHRGLFWAWPHVLVGGKPYDLWLLKGIRHRFERWLARETGPASATLGVENGWYVGDRRVMVERVWLDVRPTIGDARAIDLALTLIPESEPVTLDGAEGKSYGGLTLRFAPAPARDVRITTPLGDGPADLLMTRLAWGDLSARFAGDRTSGAAILVAPGHPDSPPCWLTRHYGVLCVGWPGVTPATLKPAEPRTLRYRTWVHRGAVDAARLARVAEALAAEPTIAWSEPGAETP